MFSDLILKNKLRSMGVNPVSGANGPSTPGGPPAQQGLLSLFGGPVTGGIEGFLNPQRKQLLGLGGSLLSGSFGQQGGGLQDQLLQMLLKQR